MAEFRPARAPRARNPPAATAARRDVPRTIGPSAAGRIGGGVTIQSPCADCARRKTPWFSPSTYGTVGPRLPRNTMTRCPTANCGAPTTMLRKRPSDAARHAELHDVSPRLPFRYVSVSSVTIVSMPRRPSVHCASTATTRPRAMATRVARELARDRRA